MDELDDMRKHLDLLDRAPENMALACIWDFVRGVNHLTGTPMDAIGQDLFPTWETAVEALDVLVAPKDMRDTWVVARDEAKRGIAAFRREKDLRALRSGLVSLNAWFSRYAAQRESRGRA